MEARTIQGCMNGTAPWLWVAGACVALGLSACNTPKYNGMPIDEFLQVMTEEDAAAAAAAGDPGDLSTTRPALSVDTYPIGPSDVLNITIYGLDRLDAPTVLPVRVTDEGSITLPLVGQLMVGGISLTEAEKRIMGIYGPRYIRDPRVLVEIKEYHLTKVLVIGAQTGARDVALRRNERTVFQSLAKSGISGDREAGMVFVQPASNPNKLESYDLSVARDVMRAMTREPLEESDIVIARPSVEPVVYVYGLVGSQFSGYFGGGLGSVMGSGIVPIPETGINLRQTIAAAGGHPTEFDLDKVVLTRRLRDGRDVCVVFKWKHVLEGKVPNIDMRPGDVIEVPHTAETHVEEILRRSIVLRMGVNAVFDPINQWMPARVDVDDGNNGSSIRRLILSDVALRGTRRVTAPLIGP